MKKKHFSAVLLCLLILTQFFSVSVSASQNEQKQSNVDNTGIDSAAVPLLGTEEKVKNCAAAFVYEAQTDTVMYAWNADVPLDPASFVKIMTGLLAIEQGNMLDMVTVDSDEIESIPIDAVSADLKDGEVLYLQDLLYCMLVGSANDAAVVIADHIGGNQDTFVHMMNERAASLGCTGTDFRNVHGLYDPEQKMTARDAARIMAAAMENELFAEIVGTVEYTVPATTLTQARELATGNYLMSQADVEIHYDSRVIGSRTGVAGDGTRGIASAAETDELFLICIVMGAKSEFQEDGYTTKIFGGYPETKTLLDLCFGSYERAQLLYENQALLQCAVAGGANEVTLGPKVSVKTILPIGVTADELTYHYEDIPGALTAPVEKGTHVSNVEIWYGSICAAEAELYAMNSVEVAATAPAADQGGTEGTGTAKTILIAAGCLLVVALVIVALFVLVNTIRTAVIKKRLRQRRRSRRRSR